MSEETEVLFVVGRVILGFISIFRMSQASSPYEPVNSVCLSSVQKDMSPPVQMKWTTMAFSRFPTVESDMPSSCEVKDEPEFKPVKGNWAFF